MDTPELPKAQFFASDGKPLVGGTLTSYVAASAFTGPIDIVPGAVVAYSAARAMSAVYRGSALYTIREDAGDTTLVCNSDAVTGLAPVAAITAFLDGANGFGSIINNQSGAAPDAEGGGGADDPKWTIDAGNGQPGFGGVTVQFVTTDVDVAAGARTYTFVVGSYTENVDDTGLTFLQHVLEGSDVQIGTYWNELDDLWIRVRDGGDGDVAWVAPITLLDGASYIIECAFDAAGALTVKVNGANVAAAVEFGESFALPAITGGFLIVPGGSNPYDLPMQEWLVWEAAVSSTPLTSNFAAFYGITLP